MAETWRPREHLLAMLSCENYVIQSRSLDSGSAELGRGLTEPIVLALSLAPSAL